MPGSKDQILACANLVMLVERQPHVFGETFTALTAEAMLKPLALAACASRSLICTSASVISAEFTVLLIPAGACGNSSTA